MDSAKKQNDSCMIELRGLTLGYGDRVLLKDVSGCFHAGELTALTGRNGSGKSTLLRAMAGLNSDYTGSILVAGSETLIATPERARTVAFVNTSRVRIANMRCCDVVALGRAPYTNWIGSMQPADERVVAEALATVGMQDYAERTLDTMSDGECQRVMIARALAQDTPVILLDEPTSFLDLPNRYQLMELLAGLAHERGKCIVLSTHELEIAMRTADRIALIDTPQLLLLDAAEAAPTVCRVFSIKNFC